MAAGMLTAVKAHDFDDEGGSQGGAQLVRTMGWRSIQRCRGRPVWPSEGRGRGRGMVEGEAGMSQQMLCTVQLARRQGRPRPRGRTTPQAFGTPWGTTCPNKRPVPVQPHAYSCIL